MKSKKYFYLLLWIALLLLVGSFLGMLTKTNIDSWYLTLNRSPLSPPNYLFSIVWSILYIAIATSGWIIWNSGSFTGLRLIKTLYIIQLALNWAWTPLFFNFHQIGAALVCLLLIIITVIGLIIYSYKKINVAALLLLPYLLWLLFAAYLNFYIWQFN